MASIEARLRKLEKELNEGRPQMVCLFGDDEVPEGLPANIMVVRFHEAFRGV